LLFLVDAQLSRQEERADAPSIAAAGLTAVIIAP